MLRTYGPGPSLWESAWTWRHGPDRPTWPHHKFESSPPSGNHVGSRQRGGNVMQDRPHAVLRRAPLELDQGRRSQRDSAPWTTTSGGCGRRCST
jgi:hypothetical protein